jgi:hypothetical protein
MVQATRIVYLAPPCLSYGQEIKDNLWNYHGWLHNESENQQSGFPDSQPRDENGDDAGMKRHRRVTLTRFQKSLNPAGLMALLTITICHASVQVIESPSPQLLHKLGFVVA